MNDSSELHDPELCRIARDHGPAKRRMISGSGGDYRVALPGH